MTDRTPPALKTLWRGITSPFTWIGVMVGLAGLVTACVPSFRGEFDGNDLVARETISYSHDGKTVDLSVLRAGDPEGQQVIFVHGTPGSATAWLRYLENTPKGREYIAIDRPGFGYTKPDREEVSLDAQAAAVKAVMETRGGQKPVLVGHSLGGPIVAAVAANYPDDVGGVIPLAGSLDPGLEEIKFIQYLGETPPFVWLIPSALRHTNREVFALEDELERLEDKLHRITAPVVIIHGTMDDLVPFENVPFMQRRMVSAEPLETIVLTDQNHFLPWNSEMILRGAIDRIIDGFPGEPRYETILYPMNAGSTLPPWLGGPSGTKPLKTAE